LFSPLLAAPYAVLRRCAVRVLWGLLVCCFACLLGLLAAWAAGMLAVNPTLALQSRALLAIS
jgi:hypothetical protein